MGAVPVLRTWVPGLISSGWLNSDVRDATEFLFKLPMGIAAFTGGGHGGGAIPWTTVTLDRDSGFSSDNRAQYVSQTPGYYHAVCRARIENSYQQADGYNHSLWFEAPDGHMGFHAHTAHLTTNSIWDYTISAEFYLALDEVVTVWYQPGWHDGSVHTADFIIRWVGK